MDDASRSIKTWLARAGGTLVLVAVALASIALAAWVNRLAAFGFALARSSLDRTESAPGLQAALLFAGFACLPLVLLWVADRHLRRRIHDENVQFILVMPLFTAIFASWAAADSAAGLAGPVAAAYDLLIRWGRRAAIGIVAFALLHRVGSWLKQRRVHASEGASR